MSKLVPLSYPDTASRVYGRHPTLSLELHLSSRCADDPTVARFGFERWNGSPTDVVIRSGAVRMGQYWTRAATSGHPRETRKANHRAEGCASVTCGLFRLQGFCGTRVFVRICHVWSVQASRLLRDSRTKTRIKMLVPPSGKNVVYGTFSGRTTFLRQSAEGLKGARRALDHLSAKLHSIISHRSTHRILGRSRQWLRTAMLTAQVVVLKSAGVDLSCEDGPRRKG